MENIELIIVDDGSTDNITPEIIRDYQKKYPENIKAIFLDENSGYPGKPRNVGVDSATSEYIIFLDNDDLYFKKALEFLYNSIKKYDSDMVIGNYCYDYDGDRFANVMKYTPENIVNMRPLESQSNFDILSRSSVSPWGKIYKKEFLLENNIKHSEDIIFEDAHFYLNILKHNASITVFPNELVYNYIFVNDSTSHNYNMELLDKSIKGTYYIADLLKDLDVDSNLILIEFISQLLVIFSNIDNSQKIKAINKLFGLEKLMIKDLNLNMHSKGTIVNLLNNAIIKKQFRKAIFISNIYKIAYNNNFIQKIYKKIRLKH